MPGPEQDFIDPGPAPVTIPAGQLSATFNVTIVGDARVESDETVMGALVNATASGRNVILDDANDQASGTIENDD